MSIIGPALMLVFTFIELSPFLRSWMVSYSVLDATGKGYNSARVNLRLFGQILDFLCRISSCAAFVQGRDLGFAKKVSRLLPPVTAILDFFSNCHFC
jgi:hypothetical protein